MIPDTTRPEREGLGAPLLTLAKSCEQAGAPLSFEAWAIASAWFALMRPRPDTDGLTFQLKSARPSDVAQAALDELVRAGAISVEPFNSLGGLRYRPLVDCFAAMRWAHEHHRDPRFKMPLTTPLVDEAEARRVQKAALRARAALLSDEVKHV